MLSEGVAAKRCERTSAPRMSCIVFAANAAEDLVLTKSYQKCTPAGEKRSLYMRGDVAVAVAVARLRLLMVDMPWQLWRPHDMGHLSAQCSQRICLVRITNGLWDKTSRNVKEIATLEDGRNVGVQGEALGICL